MIWGPALIPNAPQQISAQPLSQPSSRAPEMGVPASRRKGLQGCWTTGRTGRRARCSWCWWLPTARPPQERRSSLRPWFLFSQSLSLEAGQGGSCRPCIIPRQEGLLGRGRAPGKALKDLSKQKWDLGSHWSVLSGKVKFGGGGPACQPHPFSSSLWPLAFLGSPREKEGTFPPMVLLTTGKETSPAWGEGALQGTQTQVLILQALWEPLSTPLLPGYSEKNPQEAGPSRGIHRAPTSRILLRLEEGLWFPLPSPLSVLQPHYPHM